MSVMNMLLGFLPFIVFAVLDRTLGVLPALGSAAAISAIFLIRDWLTPNRAVKVLEIGTVLLFAGLAIYSIAMDVQWTLLGVRLRVDAGLMLVVLASIAVRKPFTLQYAKEQTSPDIWTQPAFIKTNYVLTAAWALAFAAMVLADVCMIFLPSVPLWVGVATTVVALVGAMKFTQWYPDRVRGRVRASA
jgi:hypothetical protein